MKNTIVGPTPLYTFLSYCNDSPLKKEVLDCGAGGEEPPLSVFYQHGYETRGIEISEKQLQRARQFCKTHSMELNISQGDMRKLPFENESMSFVYSYSSICHMSRNDVATAMKEMTRVLKKGGLCYITFCWSEGEPKGPGEYPYEDDGERGIHSLFAEDEPDGYFSDYTVLRKEKTQVECFKKVHPSWAEIGYFAKKL